MKKVVVLLSIHSREKYLKEQLESLFDQIFKIFR